MDQIAKIQRHLLSLGETAEPTLVAFLPLLKKNEKLITDVVKKTFKYGATDRHCLDIYYPPTQGTPGEKTPILFFIYGGGFTTGNRNRKPPFDIVYSNLGAFFAREGFITVIPDYRLSPEAQFPKAVEDILEAMTWTVSHLSNLVPDTTPNPDMDSLVLVGHSAGAAHVATLVFHPTLLPVNSELRGRIKAVVPMSGPFRCVPSSGEDHNYVAYYGTKENAKEASVLPLTLASLGVFPKEKLPKILFVEAEGEPKWMFDAGVEYRRLLEWHLNEPIEMVVGKGHNHISLFCALLSGEGEEWGVQTVNWLRKVLYNYNKKGSGETPASVDVDILGDVKDIDVFKCPKCQQQKNRSFTIRQEALNTVSLKTFVICLSCGHKWVTDYICQD